MNHNKSSLSINKEEVRSSYCQILQLRKLWKSQVVPIIWTINLVCPFKVQIWVDRKSKISRSLLQARMLQTNRNLAYFCMKNSTPQTWEYQIQAITTTANNPAKNCLSPTKTRRPTKTTSNKLSTVSTRNLRRWSFLKKQLQSLQLNSRLNQKKIFILTKFLRIRQDLTFLSKTNWIK